MVKYYIQKPILVKAIQYTETNRDEVLYFLKDTKHFTNSNHEIFLSISNSDQLKIDDYYPLKIGDYVLKIGDNVSVLGEEEFNEKFEEYYIHEEKTSK